jgi:hypothetical protein
MFHAAGRPRSIRQHGRSHNVLLGDVLSPFPYGRQSKSDSLLLLGGLSIHGATAEAHLTTRHDRRISVLCFVDPVDRVTVLPAHSCLVWGRLIIGF